MSSPPRVPISSLGGTPVIVRAHELAAVADGARSRGELEEALQAYQSAAELFSMATSEAADAESIVQLRQLADQQAARVAEAQKMLAQRQRDRLRTVAVDAAHEASSGTGPSARGSLRDSLTGSNSSIDEAVGAGFSDAPTSKSVSEVLSEYAPNIPGIHESVFFRKPPGEEGAGVAVGGEPQGWVSGAAGAAGDAIHALFGEEGEWWGMIAGLAEKLGGGSAVRDEEPGPLPSRDDVRSSRSGREKLTSSGSSGSSLGDFVLLDERASSPPVQACAADQPELERLRRQVESLTQERNSLQQALETRAAESTSLRESIATFKTELQARITERQGALMAASAVFPSTRFAPASESAEVVRLREVIRIQEAQLDQFRQRYGEV